MSNPQAPAATSNTRRLKFHETMYNHRALDDGVGHRFLDDIREHKKGLKAPVSYGVDGDLTVLYTQIVVKNILERMGKRPPNNIERALWTSLFGKFSDDIWKPFYKRFKLLQPFADNPYNVDLTLLMGDDHFVTTRITNPRDKSVSIEVLVDTALPYFYTETEEGVTIRPEAIYHKEVLPDLVPGRIPRCEETPKTLRAFVPTFDASLWDPSKINTQRMIFFCPRLFDPAIHKQRAPVRFLPGQEVKAGDSLDDVGGPVKFLLHELCHTPVMQEDGGPVMFDEPAEINDKEKKWYGSKRCRRAAKDPKNQDKCLKNADSWALWIVGMYMLDKGWDYSGDQGAVPYMHGEPEDTVAIARMVQNVFGEMRCVSVEDLPGYISE